MIFHDYFHSQFLNQVVVFYFHENGNLTREPVEKWKYKRDGPELLVLWGGNDGFWIKFFSTASIKSTPYIQNCFCKKIWVCSPLFCPAMPLFGYFFIILVSTFVVLCLSLFKNLRSEIVFGLLFGSTKNKTRETRVLRRPSY